MGHRVPQEKIERDWRPEMMDRGKIYLFDVLSSQSGNPNRLRATERGRTKKHRNGTEEFMENQ